MPAWSGLDPPARAVLTALIDGQLLSPSRLAAATDLQPAALDAVLLDLELAGLVRRTTAGIQAIGLPHSRAADPAGSAAPAPASNAVMDGCVAAVEPQGSGEAVRPAPSPGPADGTYDTAERPVPSPGPRGPPQAGPSAEVLECGGSCGDDDRDD